MTTKICIIAVAIAFVIFWSLIIAIILKRKKLEKQTAENMKKLYEAGTKAYEEKKKLHTENAADNFSNSVDILRKHSDKAK